MVRVMTKKEYRVFEQDGQLYRKCLTCQEVKAVSEYPIDIDKRKYLKEGIRMVKPHCKICYYKTHPKTQRTLNKEENVELLKQNKRKCTTCNRVKDLSEFWRNNCSTGYSSKCSECDRKRKEKGKPTSYLRETAKRYGLTLEEYNELVESNPNCQICGNPVDSPHIDHCHESGKVRGVLCKTCNMGLGSFKDNPQYMYNAIAYLAKHNFGDSKPGCLMEIYTADSENIQSIPVWF